MLCRTFAIVAISLVTSTAVALPFASADFTVNAAAVTSGDVDEELQRSPPLDVPIQADATAVSGDSTASALATAAFGALSVFTSSSSPAQEADATALSAFSGTFDNVSAVDLHFDLDLFTFAELSNIAEASLVVTIFSGGTQSTELFTTSGVFDRTFLLAPVAGQSLSFGVFSSSVTLTGGLALSQADLLYSVTLSGPSLPVPEPTTWLLLAAGILCLAVSAVLKA